MALAFLLLVAFAIACSAMEIEIGSSLKLGSQWNSSGGTFSLGFRLMDEAYNLAIWYQIDPEEIVWMATTDNGQFVHASGSAQLQLRSDGGLVIIDRASILWRTNSGQAKGASLLETGNLVVYGENEQFAWKSFDVPTTTILPEQQFHTETVSDTKILFSQSRNYALQLNRGQVFLRNNNKKFVIPQRYWYIANPAVNSSQTCLIDDTGEQVNSNIQCQTDGSLRFPAVLNLSSDGVLSYYDATGIATENSHKYALDYGISNVLRRLKLDDDGNLRMYSFSNDTRSWSIVWQALMQECDVFGACGAFGLCTYRPKKTCSCPPGFHRVDPIDDSQGCDYNVPMDCEHPTKLVLATRADYYYSDYRFDAAVTTLEQCKANCLKDCQCLAAAYKAQDGDSLCFLKGGQDRLYNGMQSFDKPNLVYMKVSINDKLAADDHYDYFMSNTNATLSNIFTAHHKESYLSMHLHSVVIAIATAELVSFAAIGVAMFSMWKRRSRKEWEALTAEIEGSPTKFTYKQLQEATNNFEETLGSGGYGTVYRGEIPEKGGIVAVKVIKAVTHAEKQFKAEVNTIGKVHHVNLVRLLGYCVEGVHRLLVYEFMPNGSLDNYLSSNSGSSDSSWQTRFSIALGIAKGIAYLHEECQECIIHCDIKPQNILLDDQMSPKIADFGLAKLTKREHSMSVTTVRGTRGYLAPEWLDGLSVTPKIDVYSFGMLLFDILSGTNKMIFNELAGTSFESFPSGMEDYFQKYIASELQCIADPKMEMAETDWPQFKLLLKVALWCIQQNPSSRPSMSRIVQLLEHNDPENKIFDQDLC